MKKSHSSITYSYTWEAGSHSFNSVNCICTSQQKKIQKKNKIHLPNYNVLQTDICPGSSFWIIANQDVPSR